jgi:nucleoside triphosphate diphosphatase
VFDGIPRHLPALLKAEKLVKKARKAKLMSGAAKRTSASSRRRLQTSRGGIAKALFELAAQAQAGGWSAEELLRSEVTKRERVLRKVEAKKTGT